MQIFVFFSDERSRSERYPMIPHSAALKLHFLHFSSLLIIICMIYCRNVSTTHQTPSLSPELSVNVLKCWKMMNILLASSSVNSYEVCTGTDVNSSTLIVCRSCSCDDFSASVFILCASSVSKIIYFIFLYRYHKEKS